jgi:hypothetical protein
MERETIIYNGKAYHRYPESKRRQLSVYFWRHDKWKSPPFSLHRQIWIDNYGEIPKGYVIHHKDENALNNSPENLECLPFGKHCSNHMLKEDRRKLSRETGKRQAERIVRQLREWRKDNPEEAHRIAVENGKNHSKKGIDPFDKWRKENPELAKRLAQENGRNSSLKRWGKNKESL